MTPRHPRIERRVAAVIEAGLAADRADDVAAKAGPDGLALSGPRLAERWLTDPALRGLARTMARRSR